jgi:hypothetical protein
MITPTADYAEGAEAHALGTRRPEEVMPSFTSDTPVAFRASADH